MVEKERFRLLDPLPPRPETDLSLRPAIAQLFSKLDAQAGTSIHKIQAKWKMIVGEKVAGHSCPGRLAGNVLYVYVDSSVWLDEISRFHSDNILRNVQDTIGAGAVKNVRFQVNPRECRLAL